MRSGTSAWEAGALLDVISTAMEQHLEAIAEDLRTFLESRFPPLGADPLWKELLEAGIADNIRTALHAVRHDIPIDRIPAPAAAEEFTRRSAQRGIPVSVLVQGYYAGLTRMQEQSVRLIAEQAGMPGPTAYPVEQVLQAVQWLLRVSNAYVDAVCGRMIELYEEEKDSWATGSGTERARLVRAVLDGDAPADGPAERLPDLGYELQRTHLAVMLWLPDDAEGRPGPSELAVAARRLGRLLKAEDAPLIVAADRISAWAWYPLGGSGASVSEMPEVSDIGPDAAALRRAWAGASRVSVALGSVGWGVEGFRRSHHHAVLAQSVALMADRGPGSVTGYEEPGLSAVAMMCSDVEAAASWVAETLGPLAADSPSAARLRETVRTFYLHSSSHKSTAADLHLHPNTVKYRVRRAEELLDRSLHRGRSDTELALSICHWLGTNVLSA